MKVELVAKTTGVGKYETLTNEEIMSAIARHGVIKEDNGRLVKYLMDNKHWSPLEMIDFTFEIQTSRAIGRQILRHRSLSFQEHSQRYSDRLIFEPVELRKEHPTNRQSSTEVFNPFVIDPDNKSNVQADILIEKLFKDIEAVYYTLIENGVAKECARMVLPEAFSTTMNAKGNLRSWLSFLNVRMDNHAQKEITEIATLIGEALEKELPNVFRQIDWRNGLFM